MKLNFTISHSRPFFTMGILALTLTGLEAQNIANFDKSQKNTVTYRSEAEGLPSVNNIVFAQQKMIHGSLPIPGRTVIAEIHNVKPLPNSGPGLVVNQPDIDPATLQFDLTQNDLGDLYKLLEYYKTEAGEGKSIILIRQKKNAGQAIDSFYDIRKYVVADDL